MGVCNSTKRSKTNVPVLKEISKMKERPEIKIENCEKFDDRKSLPVQYDNQDLKPKSGSMKDSRDYSKRKNTDDETGALLNKKIADKRSPSFTINRHNSKHERNITSPGLKKKKVPLLVTDPGYYDKPILKLSTDSFSFMKKNIEDFARKKPFPNLNLDDFDEQLMHSESMHKPDSVDFQRVWEGLETANENNNVDGQVNISFLDAELQSLALLDAHHDSHHHHDSHLPHDSHSHIHHQDLHDEKHILTPGLKNHSQILSRTLTPLNRSISNYRDYKENLTLGSEVEILMIRKYTKLWHGLALSYKSNSYWIESLECLRPIIQIYRNLRLFNHLKACLAHLYFIGIMLCIEKKIGMPKQVPHGQVRLFEDLLQTTEDYIGDDWEDSEILVVIGLFYELARGKEPEKERLNLFISHLDQLKIDHHESDVFSKVEFDDMYLLAKWYLEGPRRDPLHNHSKFLSFSSHPKNHPLYVPNEEAKQDFRSFILRLDTYLTEINALKLNKTTEWKIPVKQKGLSFLLMKMGNVLRIWLELPLHALFFYNHSLRIDSTNTESLFYAGITYRSLGKTRLAIQSYLSAIKNEPNYIDCLYNLGNLYLDEFNNLEKAEECYRRAILAYEECKDKSKFPLVTKGRILCVLSEIYKFRGNLLKAALVNVLGIRKEPLYSDNYTDLSTLISELLPDDNSLINHFNYIYELLTAEVPIEQELIKRFHEMEKNYSEVCNIPSTDYETEVYSDLLSGALNINTLDISDIFTKPIETFLNNIESNFETKFLRFVLIEVIKINLKDLEEIFTPTCFEERQYVTTYEEEFYMKISYELRKILEL